MASNDMTVETRKKYSLLLRGIYYTVLLIIVATAFAWNWFPEDSAQFKKQTDSLNRIIQVQRDSASYYRGMAAGYITQITQLQQDIEKKYETIKNIKDASNKKVAAVADYSNDSLASFLENRYK